METTMDDRYHELNQGRESLFDLEVGKYYLVEGKNAALYSTYKDSNIRFTITDVIIRPYRNDIGYESIPVIGFAEHINTIRKTEGLSKKDLKEGTRNTWIGLLEEYESVKNPGIKRRSFKLQRDVRIDKEIHDLESRIRNMDSLWESLSPEEIESRNSKSMKMLYRIAEIKEQFRYVPHYSLEEIDGRIKSMQDWIKLFSIRASMARTLKPQKEKILA